ncbi:MAG: iron ABC transporter substrate-binding protein, partial [Myxococcota bacterium]
YFRDGKAHSLINAAGAAILASSKNKDAAAKFLEYLVSDSAQSYFAGKNFEFPLVSGIDTPITLPDVATLNAPVVDLAELRDLKSAAEVLREAGVLK